MSTSDPKTVITLKVEFTGGLEILFSNQRKHTISFPSHNPVTGQRANVGYLIHWLCEEKMTDKRKEMFIGDDVDGDGMPGVRPGILVLINDADWELEGEEKYQVQEGDEIVFVSTLHGG